VDYKVIAQIKKANIIVCITQT